MEIIHREEHAIASRAQWLEWRKQDVTASDVGAVCGVHPIRSPLQVYADKTGLIAPDEDNNIMRRGRWLEPAVIAAVADQNPDWKVQAGTSYWRLPELRIGATPDAYLRVPGEPIGVLQCKVVARMVFERDWIDGPPIYYQLQALTEARAAGLDMAKVAALVIGEFSADLEVYNVALNEPAFDKICQAVGNFWRDIAEGKQPRADYGKDAGAISELYKANNQLPPVDLSGDNRLREVCDAFKATAATEKQAAEQRKALRAEIVEKLAGAPKATCGPYKISNTPVSVKEHMVSASQYDRLTVTAAKA